MNDKITNIKWLVKNRSDVQKTALDLYSLIKDEQGSPKRISLIMQDLVGALFCLWRGVFLAYQKTSDPGKPPIHAKDFLKKVIEDNSIGFSDDKRFMEWTANFYVDGAGRLLAGFSFSKNSKATPRCETISPPWQIENYPAEIKDRWEYNHEILKGKIYSLKRELTPPKKQKSK